MARLSEREKEGRRRTIREVGMIRGREDGGPKGSPVGASGMDVIGLGHYIFVGMGQGYLPSILCANAVRTASNKVRTVFLGNTVFLRRMRFGCLDDRALLFDCIVDSDVLESL